MILEDNRMKAWRFYALGDMRLDDVPYPGNPKPGWVTLKVKVVQPSVTEAIRARGGPTMDADLIRKRIEEEAPVQLLGHEFTGEVVELGEGVLALKKGDRVAARSKIPCYQCALCKAGLQDRCRKGPSIGRHMPGAFAEYLAVPAEALAVLPAAVSDSEGACIQSLGSSMADVADTQIQPGDTVVVLGQGVMGLNVMQLAKVNGAGITIGVDVRPTNLRLSKELGSDYQVDAAKDDPVAVIREITDGLGANVVFECAGGSPKEGLSGSKTLEQAFQIVTDAGKVVQVSHFGQPIEFRPDVLRRKSIRYIFPQSSSSKLFEHVIRLVAAGQVKIKPTISHVLVGLDKVPEAFEITGNKGKYDTVNPAQVVVSR
jgi:threonine dehydrogenase-like Zn-dependent dehydrogenase